MLCTPAHVNSNRQKVSTMTHKIVKLPKRTSTAAFLDVQKLLQQRRRSVVALAFATIVALLGVLAQPSPPSLSTMVTGDAVLAARARPLLHGALDRVSIAVVDGSTITYAHFGANEHTQYEIGSLTKTFTALLLADAIRRGEVTADTKIGALLPLGGTPIADVTLAELASHRSGLSTQGMHLDNAIPFALRYLRHRDPFIQDVDGVLAIARKATLTDHGGFVYSNLGVALLGHALAAAAHMDYTQIIQERLFTPLGMGESSLPSRLGTSRAARQPATARRELPRHPGPSTAGHRRVACARPQPIWFATRRRCSTALRPASTRSRRAGSSAHNTLGMSGRLRSIRATLSL
jgi:CubicO group peptidase (beta-lactamase class C family)